MLHPGKLHRIVYGAVFLYALVAANSAVQLVILHWR